MIVEIILPRQLWTVSNNVIENLCTCIFSDNPTIVKGFGQSTASTVNIGANAYMSRNPVQIRCNLASNLNLSRHWTRNGVTQSETGNTLTVSQCTTGVYCCKVSNGCGTDSATTTVRSKNDFKIVCLV